jgi:hypothetical protein
VTQTRFFSGRQVVTIVITICLTIVLMPAAVWAASTSLVRISDGSGKVAQVDKKGHLLVSDGSGPMTVNGKVAITGRVSTTNMPSPTTINLQGFDFPASGFFAVAITSTTKATLAVTELVYDNSLNAQFSNTDVTAQLVQITVGPSGSCFQGDRTITVYRSDAVPQGEGANASFSSPLLFRPVGGKAYCIGFQPRWVDVTDPTSSHAVLVTLGAYVVAGTYSGPATNALRASRAQAVRHSS